MPAFTVTARMSRKSGRSASMLSRRRRPCAGDPAERQEDRDHGQSRAGRPDSRRTRRRDHAGQQQDRPTSTILRSSPSTVTPIGPAGVVDQPLQVRHPARPDHPPDPGHEPPGQPFQQGEPAGGLPPPLLPQQDQVGGVEVLTGPAAHHPVAEDQGEQGAGRAERRPHRGEGQHHRSIRVIRRTIRCPVEEHPEGHHQGDLADQRLGHPFDRPGLDGVQRQQDPDAHQRDQQRRSPATGPASSGPRAGPPCGRRG